MAFSNSTASNQRDFSSPDDLVIKTNKLVKQYKSKGDKATDAVRGLDLAIKKGEIFGLIGPDGAGKTTTFHMLGGVLAPTSGEVYVLNTNPRDARPHIGYLTQQFSLNLDLSIDENLEYTAGIRQIPDQLFQELRKKYLRLMDIEKFSKRLAGQLSGGMKQKLALCCALIYKPEVLLLDEPTTGVDPVSRREFWDILAAISNDGVTIAVATPYLDEAERCNRVALMHEGVVKQLGTPAELRNSLQLHRLEVRASDIERLEHELQHMRVEQTNIVDILPFGDRLDVLVKDADKGAADLQSFCRDKLNIKLSIEKEEPTLENVFVMTLKQSEEISDQIPAFSFSDPNRMKRIDNMAIEAQNINKVFGDFQAVKNVSIDIKYGEIYGLLGANGAGKTTTIKMLSGLLEPTSGNMSLAGKSENLRKAETRKHIGYMSQKFTLYDDLTILENLEFYCGVYEVPKKMRKDKIKWVLSTFDLVNNENLITGKLPGGWKQRLSFGASVMHEPQILFLDEPTSGVDPIARRQLWQLISEFARQGTAILVTTHFLEEAEHCHRLGFMVAGQLVAQGTPSELKANQPGSLIVLKTNNNQLASDILKERIDSWRVSIFADKLHLVLDKPETELPSLINILEKEKLQVISHKPGSFSLEDAFIGVVKRAVEVAA